VKSSSQPGRPAKAAEPARLSGSRVFWLRLRGSPGGILGVAVFLAWVTVALFAPLLAPYEYTGFHPQDRYQPPSTTYVFGTDQYGRDMFSRVVMGSRSILTVAVGVAVISTALGILLGFISGYFGGLWDELLMRLVDILMSLPALLLASVVLVVLGKPGIGSLMVIIALVFAPRTARVSRGVVLEIKNREFVDAGRLQGESHVFLMFHEIFPNTLGPIVVEGTARFAYAIMTIASLGFLGIGLQPPTPDWGYMIAEYKTIVFLAPWTVIFPALAIASLIIGVSLFADFANRSLRRNWD